ncbi:hypothetical protein [Geomonas propionica]|uniref:Uncharacterized protein n=1 Tax=Geomonas propionica TaxID=2798582 RepID=A0ABS0YQF9_9BACT|nr:hypothetical protein [Geomonas propionica]MBJ6800155.1 hypothetical protein [Geomonas propionica]
MTYITTGNSSFDTIPADLSPIEVFTTNPLYEIDPGHIVRDTVGRRFTVGKITLVGKNVYSVYLIPIPQEVANA